jgi:hypothetical protein
VIKVVAAAVLMLIAALPADAQRRASSPQQQYCEALSDLYMRYVGNPETEPRSIRRNDAEAEEALSQCRRGNSAGSIPVRERKLTDNRITLPAHP